MFDAISPNPRIFGSMLEHSRSSVSGSFGEGSSTFWPKGEPVFEGSNSKALSGCVTSTALSNPEISQEIALTPRLIVGGRNAQICTEGLSGRQPAKGQDASRWRAPTPTPAPQPAQQPADPLCLCAAADAWRT